MINQHGRVALEKFKELNIKRKKEVDGEVKEVDDKITIRIDLIVPLACPYTVIDEALEEFKAEIEKMKKISKEREEEEKKNKETEKESK